MKILLALFMMLPAVVLGDGSVFTTVEDLAKWDENNFENRLEKGTQELLDTVLTRGKLNDDAYEPMDRYLIFRRTTSGHINGFSMDADPIHDIALIENSGTDPLITTRTQLCRWT